jgi:hypothetical protein
MARRMSVDFTITCLPMQRQIIRIDRRSFPELALNRLAGAPR